jgi:hypothetical protein
MKKFIFVSFILLAVFVFNNSFAQTKLVLSSRSFHYGTGSDTLNTLKVIDQLSPARLDWIYCETPSILNLFKARKLPFSIAINPNVPDSGNYTTKKFRIVDIDGNPYVAPWVSTTNAHNIYWGCVNHPLFQRFFTDKCLKFIDLGAYAIFVDDALMNVQLQQDRPNKYGCFCEYCLKGFCEYLDTNNANLALLDPVSLKKLLKTVLSSKQGKPDLRYEQMLVSYQNFQKQSVLKFWINWKKKMLAYKPAIKTLTNNYNGSWNEIYSMFDGGISELSKDHLNIPYLDSIYQVADKLHKTQLFTLVSSDQNAHNYLMAYSYSRGRDYLIPWDLYAPKKTNPFHRYYTNINDLKKLSTDLRLRKTRIAVNQTNGNVKSTAKNGFFNVLNNTRGKVIQLNKFPLTTKDE